jgi:peptidoglycan/LPS O-acetylase OafA/YrhL
MNRPSARSFISIDIARAMAALGVFYYHQHIGSLLAKYSGVEWLKLTDSFGASYAVPLFFLISGYCIHLSNLKYVRAGRALPLREYYRRCEYTHLTRWRWYSVSPSVF